MREVLGLTLLTLVAACGATTDATPTSLCSDKTCPPGEACDPGTGRCLTQILASPALEVLPPSDNNQGWVAQEFARPSLGQDGSMNLRLSPAVSIEGGVYASDDLTTIIPAHVVVWRDSLLQGRPRVQFETSTGAGRDGGKETFVLWVGQATYSLFIYPLAPYDAMYPPLVVSSMKVDSHLKQDFILDGLDRAVVIKGTVVDYNAAPLDLVNAKIAAKVSEKDVALSPSVRIRAFESEGDHRSTVGTTDPLTGAFTFKVPAGVATYDVKIESTGVLSTLKGTSEEGMPVPSLVCKKIVLGLAPSQGGQPVQKVGEIRLPSFRYPLLYTCNVRGKDGTPIKGAKVTFSTTIKPLASNSNFEICSATYSRTAHSDATGKVKVLLLPAPTTTLSYAVTVVSPSDSAFASQWIPSREIGLSGGQLEDIVLDPRLQLSGQVLREDTSKPVAGVTIEASGVSPGTDTAKVPVTTVSATTDDQGSYALYVDPGIHNLDVRPPQDSGLPSFGMTAKIDADVLGKVFVIPTPKVVLGQVLDPTGKPLPEARVQMYELVPEVEKPLTQKAALRASAVTDIGGLFGMVVATSPQ